jgi:hypothetical protein
MSSFNIIGALQDGRKTARVTAPGAWASLINGTGIIAVSPTVLAHGANAVAGITKIGTFFIILPAGATGTATSNGATVDPSPTNLVAGVNTITVTVLGAGTITVTLVLPAAPTIEIEVPGIRTIDAVIAASIDGGYFVNPSLCTVVGNKVTVQPMYFDYAGAVGPAIVVPRASDLSTLTISLVVIGY